MKHVRMPIGFLTTAPVSGFSDDGKLLSVFLWSNRHMNTVGLYRLPVAYIAADLGWTLQRAAVALREVALGRVAKYETAHGGWVFVRGFLKANSIKNPTAGKTAATEVMTMPPGLKPLVLLYQDLKPFEAKLPAGFMADLRARALGHSSAASNEAETAPAAVAAVVTVAATIAGAEDATPTASEGATEPATVTATVETPEGAPVISKRTEEDLRDALRSREIAGAADCDLSWLAAGAGEAQELAIRMLLQHGVWLTDWGPTPGDDDFTLQPWCAHLEPHLATINHDNIEFV